MKDKWKYFAGAAIGWFLSSSSSTLTNLIELGPAYSKLKTQYLYTPEVYDSTWSNNSEYITDGVELGLDHGDGSKVVMMIKTNDDGSISGVIYKKSLCDFNPLTDSFYLESPAPSWLDLFSSRYFYVSFLHDGRHEYLAKLKLTDYNSSKKVMTFETNKDDEWVLGSGFKVSAMLPAADDDIKEIESYCMARKGEFFKKILREVGESKKKKL